VNGHAPPHAPLRLTRNEAEARTLLAQHVQRRECAVGGRTLQISMEPLAVGGMTGFGARDWSIQATWCGATFELRLPESIADQWLRARFGELELPRLPQPYRDAAFEAALNDVLTAIETAGHGPVRIEQARQAPAEPTPERSHHFGLAMTDGDVTMWGTLFADSLGLMALAGAAADWRAAVGPLGVADIPARLRAEIGRATLSPGEIASLRTGDAVLLQRCWIDDEGSLLLGCAGGALRVRGQESGLVVTRPFKTEEEYPMDEEFEDEHGDAGELADEAPVALHAVPVRLQFDLGERTMPLAEVCELQLGQVLDLGRPLSHVVNIRANGALVGTGELIEIGGRIAVSIASLGRQGGSQP
jgi:type III secretion protein Q